MLALIKLVPIWVYIALAGAGIIGGQHLALSHAEKSRDDYKAQAEQNAKTVEALHATLEQQTKLAADTKKVADDYQGKLENADQERTTLAHDLADANRRLFVKAHYVPVRSASTNSAAAPSADAGTCQLDDSARSDYLNLRAGIKQQQAQIIYLQSYVKTLYASCKIGG